MGIGVTAALFTVMDAARLRPLPLPKPEQPHRLAADTGQPDRVTIIAAAALLAATSTTAAWLPARRAAPIDPVQALRSE